MSEWFSTSFPQGFAFGTGGDRFDVAVPRPEGPENDEEVDHLLELVQRGPGAPDGPPGFVPRGNHIFIERKHGPGFRAMIANPANSNLVFSDEKGSLELTLKDGQKSLVAKNPKGEQLFSGPVTTPEQRAAMPAEVRERLEDLEGMQDVSFKTDEDFRGSESRVVRPAGRGVSFPLPTTRPALSPHTL